MTWAYYKIVVHVGYDSDCILVAARVYSTAGESPYIEKVVHVTEPFGIERFFGATLTKRLTHAHMKMVRWAKAEVARVSRLHRATKEYYDDTAVGF